MKATTEQIGPDYHWREDEWDNWRYVSDCGCSMCLEWEREVVELDKVEGYEDEPTAWGYQPPALDSRD